MHEFLREITPHKKPPNNLLSNHQEFYKKTFAFDRILIENFFGSLCSLWSVLSRKYVWAEKSYEKMFKFAVALTNLHLQKNPLRSEDGEWYNRYRNRMQTITNKKETARKDTQAQYREKRKLRLSQQFRAPENNSD